MQHYIVAGRFFVQQLMKVKYFKLDLGSKHSKEEKGQGAPVFNFNNSFIKYYFDQHKRLPNMNGHIGTIEVYVDQGRPDKTALVWLEGKQAEFTFDDLQLLEAGSIESYLGNMLLHVEGTTKIEVQKPEVKPEHNYEKIFLNPGLVSWDDLVAYKQRNFKK